MSETFELQDRRSPNKVKGPPPPIAPDRPVEGIAPARPGSDESQRIVAYKAELDQFRAWVVGFAELDPSEILGRISGIAGRVAEIRAELLRVNTPRYARLRTTEVDPLRDDLDFQFKLISRRIAVLEWEWRVSGGGT